MELKLGTQGRVGVVIVTVILFLGISSPFLSPYEPEDLFPPYLPPSFEHPLGTDDIGHDILTHLLHGARTSILVGLSTASISTFFGLLFALFSGYYSRLDRVTSTLLDLILSIPRLPLLVILSAYLQPNVWFVVLFLSSFGWAITARVIRPFVKQERSRGYVERLKAVGFSDIYILLRHLLPATFPLAVVQFVTEAGHAILAEASVGFFGLEDPTTLSWGMEIQHALQRSVILLTNKWHWVLAPYVVALTLLLLGMTLTAIDLERKVNPRLEVRIWRY